MAQDGRLLHHHEARQERINKPHYKPYLKTVEYNLGAMLGHAMDLDDITLDNKSLYRRFARVLDDPITGRSQRGALLLGVERRDMTRR